MLSLAGSFDPKVIVVHVSIVERPSCFFPDFRRVFGALEALLSRS